jgi:hypothetical protein
MHTHTHTRTHTHTHTHTHKHTTSRTHAQADITINITWVDADGNVRVSDRLSPEGHALSGGVGMLGVITGVRLFWGECKAAANVRQGEGAAGWCSAAVRRGLWGHPKAAASRAIADASPPMCFRAAETAVQLGPPSLTKAVSKTFQSDAHLADDISAYLKARHELGRGEEGSRRCGGTSVRPINRPAPVLCASRTPETQRTYTHTRARTCRHARSHTSSHLPLPP